MLNTYGYGLPDIRAKLEFRSAVIQSQGLSALLGKMQQAFTTPKERTATLSLFFDCLSVFGKYVAQWTTQTIPLLLDKGVFTKEELISECLVKLSDTENQSLIIRILLQNGDMPARTYLAILRKCPQISSLLISNLCSMKIDSVFTILRILLFCQELPQVDKILVLSHIFSQKEMNLTFCELFLKYLASSFSDIYVRQLESSMDKTEWLLHNEDVHSTDILSIDLYSDNLFTLAEKIIEIPSIILNPTFPTHHLLLPSLMTIYSNRTEIDKTCPGTIPQDQLLQIKKLIAQCQTVKRNIICDLNDNMSDFAFLQWICSNGMTETMVNMWLSRVKYVRCSKYSVTFVTALLPFCTDSVECLALIKEMVKNVPEYANSLVLVFSTLYVKPYFDIDRLTVLKVMRSLVTNRYVVSSVVNFLIMATRHPGNERILAFSLLGELVKEFPTIFDQLSPLALTSQSDDLITLRSKLSLMETLCVETDRSEELLPSLTALLKMDGDILTAGVDVVKTLCKEDILDITAVRKQLCSRVRKAGNEDSLVGYCEILALAAHLDEENWKDFRGECIKELWQFVDSVSPKVPSTTAKGRAAAWKALGGFDFDAVQEKMGIPINDIVPRIITMGDIERSGFSKFLHQMLVFDIEMLPRTLYTRQYKRENLMLTQISNMYDTLLVTNQESPWMWAATLPLFGAIVSSIPASRGTLQATKTFRRLLREVPAKDDNLIQFFAGWRVCVSEILKIYSSVKQNDYIWARDQIIEECKRVLQQSVMSVNNVIAILSVLPVELKRVFNEFSNSADASSFDSNMRSWIVSVFEFLLPIVSLDYQATSKQIFSIDITTASVMLSVARSAVWLLRQFASKDDVQYFNPAVFQGIEEWRIAKELDPSGDLVNGLLNSTTVTADYVSRWQLWTIGIALGADPVVIESLDEVLPVNRAAEEQVMQLEEQAENEDQIKTLLSFFSQLPRASVLTHEKKVKRQLERLWSLGGEEMRRTIYEGLSQFCILWYGITSDQLPSDYGYLAKGCLLRTVLNITEPKINSSFDTVDAVLLSLVGQKRSDGRTLPPLDWYSALSRFIGQANTQLRLTILKIACQENHKKLIYQLTRAFIVDIADKDYLLEISRNLANVLNVIPSSQSEVILKRLLKFAIYDPCSREQIIMDIDKTSNNQIVLDILLHVLPDLKCSLDILDFRLRNLKSIDFRFKGRISRAFDFWLECRNENKLNIHELMEIYEKEEEAERPILLCILGYFCLSLSPEMRISKILDLITTTNVIRANGKREDTSLPLFFVLICSSPSDIPLNWISTEKDIMHVMRARWNYFWNTMQNERMFENILSLVVQYLFPIFVSPLTSVEDLCVVRGMLLSILSRKPTVLQPLLEEQGEFWDKLFG